MELIELTLDQIDEELANARQRGVYKPMLEDLSTGDALYKDFTAEFPASKPDSLKNSLKQNIDKAELKNLRVIVKSEHVLVINTENVAKAKAQA
jgi:hypothetical protein